MRLSQRRQRGIALIPLLVIAGIVLLFWLFRHEIAGSFGTFLDIGGAPVKAEAAIVLAGGWTGERVLKGGELVRQGFVPYVLLSGPRGYYERPECDYAIPFAQDHGYPAQSFVCVPMKAFSTMEEAAEMIREVRRRRLKRVLLVTSDFHTRRARAFFHKEAPEIEFIPVSTPVKTFDLTRWYQTREGWKTVVLEWTKLITSKFGI